LDKGVSIDVGVLCNFIDMLCTNLVSSVKLREGGVFSIILPRSWLNALRDCWDNLTGKEYSENLSEVAEFLEAIQDYLKQLLLDKKSGMLPYNV
jgi:hypothetical protein